MTIRILDPQLVSMIAAGEVVERPSSVVKELVENSLDARATDITVEIHNGGLTLIRVIDNGAGISQNDLPLAFQRHATSKLTSLSDLHSINTLGFRGEALPSIAAVADIEISTIANGELSGSYIKLKEGSIIDSKTQAHPLGTAVTVHNLFYTTPARLKFIKSARAETARISYLVCQIALAYPEVQFTLSVDGRTTLRTAGTGNLRETVAQVYSRDIANSLLALANPVESGFPICPSPFPSVSGMVSPPHLHRSNRAYLSYFINRRWIYDRFLSRAIDEAYHGLLPSNRFPVVILNVTLALDMLDINVHPTKREIRFKQENVIFSIVTRSIKQALGIAPVPVIGLEKSVQTVEYRLDGFPSPLPQHHSPETKGRLTGSSESSTALAPEITSFRVLGQLDNTYLVAEGVDGLYLVDQHAAHERILYESIQNQYLVKEIDVQGLLQPVLLELTSTEDEVLKTRLQDLSNLGFAMESFGERSYLVRSIPSLLRNGSIEDTLREILNHETHKELQDWLNRTITSLACHGAIKAGQHLTDQESRELLSQLEQTSLPRNCPHGRPTMIHLSSGQLHRHFGRA